MIIGILIVLAGIVMSGPGVPGPGIVTIIVGLGFLALEFDWAERWLERVIRWGDRAAERAERTTTKQRVAAGIATAAAVAAFAVAALPLGHPAHAGAVGIRRPRTRVQPAPRQRWNSRSRSSTRRILPVSVFGRSSTNSISRG